MVCMRLDKIESGMEKINKSVEEIRGIAFRGRSDIEQAIRGEEQVRDSVEKLRQSLSTFSRTLFNVLKDAANDGGTSKR